MDTAFIQALQATVASFTLPEYNEIPDVGLFLDQVVRYTAKYTDAISIAPLTGSMISNYVKKKVISNPVKKLYDREQIACLLFIAITKSVISIDDMGFLFRRLEGKCSLAEAYGYFRKLMLASIGQVFHQVDAAEEPIQPEFDSHSMLKNICIAASHEIYLDHCISTLKQKQETEDAE